MRSARDDGLRSDRGSATAEFAVVLPAVLVLAVLLVTVARAALLPVALADAAADAARLAARGEAGAATARAVAAAPGATMSTERDGGLLCVEVRAPVIVAGLGRVGESSARGCALDDSGAEGGAP
ncbi:pilus assembly protein [Cnuibacter physcomitrellae]|uniref:TadE family type IV pilus minor pilin n=1 Tax=Cnuibacter physcomitrellae TaxID=1619308 RepID=UPI0021760E43|nr:TadE family type IV pilus minor pilin [Cnuibacter physcomitrellae]MCS5496165.1 pilus assembly protein [Cnuibacter physcomitrellae]